MAGTKRSRSVSSELLGDSSQARTLSNRPHRRSAGSRLLPQGYVDPNEALRTMIEEDSASDDESGDNCNPKRKRWSKIKRRLSPCRALSPTPPVQDLPFEEEKDEVSSTDEDSNPKTLSLKFYVPRGHVGPFVVNLDLSSLTRSIHSSHSTTASYVSKEVRLHSGSELSPTPTRAERSNCPAKTGFLDLPAELRNIIYRLALVTELPICLRNPGNFSRSASLLATCRQVHDEATQILYGENKFQLDRQWHTRAPYYGKAWEEVAYKDCFRFLKTIGPINLSLIRDLRLLGEDGPRSGRTIEGLRFVNDEYLIQCLKLVAQHGRLQNLELSFQGKRMVKFTDYRFLNHLLAVKADHVKFTASRQANSYHRWYYPHTYRGNSNLQSELDTMIKAKCERKTRIF